MRLCQTVTPLRPFLRWDPVGSRRRSSRCGGSPPASRCAGSRGALRRHSGPRHAGDHGHTARRLRALGARATSATGNGPTATSLRRRRARCEAELHGEFDEAIGSSEPRGSSGELLAIALRENGSFFDLDVPRHRRPAASAMPQPGVRLETQAGTAHADPVTLPLPNPGDPLPPGQYVVHDTPELTPAVPARPPGARRSRSCSRRRAATGRSPASSAPRVSPPGTRATGPSVEPFRLVLDGGRAALGQASTGTVITVSLPPGDVQRFRLALLPRADRPGAVRSVAQPAADDHRTCPTLIEAASDGWLWALTPFENVTLVHAVPRPLEAPRPTKLLARSGARASRRGRAWSVPSTWTGRARSA